MVELAVFENTHAANVCLDPMGVQRCGHSQVEDLRGRPGRGTALISRSYGATTAARLRFQKSRNIPELVSDRRSVDSPERAADVQPPFPLQYLHAAAADGGVYVFVDPRPRDRRNLRQIDGPGNAAHIVTAMPVSRWQM